MADVMTLKRGLAERDIPTITRKVDSNGQCFDEVKLRILNDVTKKRRTRGPLTEDEVKLQKIVEKRRENRRKWNRRYLERTGCRITMIAIDRVKRMKSENDELDNNLDNMLTTVKDLREKFIGKLAKREQGIASGTVDPNEPAGKEQERQMKQWLLVVPSLLQHYEDKKVADDAAERDLSHLTTVFNYIDQGNNSGAQGAVVPLKRELPEVVESDGEDDDDDVEVTEDESDGEESADEVSGAEESDDEKDSNSEDDSDSDLESIHSDSSLNSDTEDE